MNPMFVGRLIFNNILTTGLNRAYTELQTRAFDSAAAPMDPWPRNTYGKRSWEESRSNPISYAQYMNIPLDVVTGYCDLVGNGQNALDPTRDFIDLKETSPSVLIQLTDAMATLTAVFIAKMRLVVPEQYKTQMQYLEMPMAEQAAWLAMSRFTFQKVSNKGWKVFKN
jgi:hypothetical protein